MMKFKEDVLRQLKTARDKEEIEYVVSHSVQRLRDNNVNGHVIQRFILSMHKMLQQVKMDDPSENTNENMNIAIALFRQLQPPAQT